MPEGNEDTKDQIDLALRTRVTLIILVSPEEERAFRIIKEGCDRWNPPRQCVAWDIVEGWQELSGKQFSAPTRDPLTALDEIGKTDENAVIILKDFHEYWANPAVKRKLRNYAQKLRYSRRSIVVITSSLKVPDEIRDECVILHLPPRLLGSVSSPRPSTRQPTVR